MTPPKNILEKTHILSANLILSYVSECLRRLRYLSIFHLAFVRCLQPLLLQLVRTDCLFNYLVRYLIDEDSRLL